MKTLIQISSTKGILGGVPSKVKVNSFKVLKGSREGSPRRLQGSLSDFLGSLCSQRRKRETGDMGILELRIDPLMVEEPQMEREIREGQTRESFLPAACCSFFGP